jgi:hypothetical protein
VILRAHLAGEGAQRLEVIGEPVVVERRRILLRPLLVPRDGARLHGLVPLAQLVQPRPALEQRRSRLEAPADLGMQHRDQTEDEARRRLAAARRRADRLRLHVGKAVDEAELERLEQQAVAPATIGDAGGQGVLEHLAHEAEEGLRAVRSVHAPRAGAGRVEAVVVRHGDLPRVMKWVIYKVAT